MSCTRMETRLLGYIDGRLKESEQREMEKHLAACPACTVRVNEFRSVSSLLDELPQIEPSAAFDLRVRARIAAEPVKQNWWSWVGAAPRVLVAASMLLLATVWVGHRPADNANMASSTSSDETQIMQDQDLPVLENYDVLANFEPLTELSQADSTDDSSEQEM
ncbi:MAG TPA: zf-HC2 domain-containing protein [Candidatus Acidoferrales bacterium]|jgi:anti-sigma factor RsiW|nr:zf-HC2 domain-containing protein [Candidatus Acidoferrales bacterium]